MGPQDRGAGTARPHDVEMWSKGSWWRRRERDDPVNASGDRYSDASAAFATAIAMACGLPAAGPGNAFVMTATAMS